jgi:uncharacterized damage-inducible protein DinB
MNADQAKFLAANVGQNLQQEWKTTYKVISAVPDAKKDFKQQENSRSAWDLAHHIAVCDVGFLHAVTSGTFSGTFPAKTSATTITELADWYKHEFPKGLEQVLAKDGAHLATVIENWGMKLPVVAFFFFCNNHMIHHRGQLSTYLRPMGSKCPMIYGSSFDEKFPS